MNETMSGKQFTLYLDAHFCQKIQNVMKEHGMIKDEKEAIRYMLDHYEEPNSWVDGEFQGGF